MCPEVTPVRSGVHMPLLSRSYTLSFLSVSMFSSNGLRALCFDIKSNYNPILQYNSTSVTAGRGTRGIKPPSSWLEVETVTPLHSTGPHLDLSTGDEIPGTALLPVSRLSENT